MEVCRLLAVFSQKLVCEMSYLKGLEYEMVRYIKKYISRPKTRKSEVGARKILNQAFNSRSYNLYDLG
jgi:hypothetical protein